MRSSLLGLLLTACGGSSTAEPGVTGAASIVLADEPTSECFPHVEGSGNSIMACYQARRIVDDTDVEHDYYALSMYASAEVNDAAGVVWVEAIAEPDGPAILWPEAIPADRPLPDHCKRGLEHAVGPGLTCGSDVLVEEESGSIRSQWTGRGGGFTAGVEFATIVAVPEGERPAWVLSWGIHGCMLIGSCDALEFVSAQP